MAGVAFNAEGQAEGSMGVAVGDADNDGDLDIFVTNLSGESHAFYVNLGRGRFEDRRARGRSRRTATRRTPASGPTGSITTTTACWICSLQTVPSPSSRPFAATRFRFARGTSAARTSADGRFRDAHRRSRPRRCSSPRSVAVRPSATWTTTATSTCSLPSTADGLGCC